MIRSASRARVGGDQDKPVATLPSGTMVPAREAYPQPSEWVAGPGRFPSGLNSNKGTKSDIEIAPAERALDRFNLCFF
jgi:hypothetical protein